MIPRDDFRRLDLRIGEIASAEPIDGSRRLLRIEVDLGDERRVLVAGLAGHYGPESLLGLQVAVLANIEPAVITGSNLRGCFSGPSAGPQPLSLRSTGP